MGFALMADRLPRAAVRAFLKDLEDALDTFVTAMEHYLASGAQASRPHAELAVEHGIAVHRASLEWTRSALAALKAPPASQVPPDSKTVDRCCPREGGSDPRSRSSWEARPQDLRYPDDRRRRITVLGPPALENHTMGSG